MRFRHIAIAAIAVVLTACGAATSTQTRTKGVEGTPVEIVSANALARWNAIIDRDLNAAYEYLTPGTRATTPFDAYRQRFLGVMIRWTKARIEKVECNDPDVCTARLYITYKVRPAQSGTGEIEGYSPVEEQWIRTGGQWYYLPDKTGR
ncbi:hypothetical protein OS187_09490 [Xanthomonadaceae bacterium JHOS43]|nr:hypothetical protein [Xanthomonadaceae bacterium JHOS43]